VPDTIDLDRHKTNLGLALELIRNFNNITQEIAAEGESAERRTEADRIRTALDESINRLPRLDDLNQFALNTDPDIFFEILCMSIKNNLLSFQGWLKKTENLNINILKRRADALKNDYLQNADQIFETERRITALLDAKLSSMVSCFKIFENLNNERMTPAFLALTKNRSDGKLSQITKDDGSNFADEEDRYKHIFDTHEKLYKNGDGNVPMPDNIIEEFLGDEIINSDLVKNSKLTVDESTWLDRPLTLAELDIAAKKGKLRSAPGADGFSNYLIIKIWPYIRLPFFNYVDHCYETGLLTQNFRSATIRLIPKKGNATLLKNWRPISLLSNFYKILSRAINSRLNKFVNRICSRAQKGYNASRYTQEVLINVWEQIQFCRNNNVKGAVVAIDMAKAFDTLSHNFLSKVYKFFNMGPAIIKWLSLLGNERLACINLCQGRKTKFFKLGRGRPQGDNISPNTFNFTVQILIFKLELDPLVKKVPRVNPIITRNVNSFFVQESNRETDKNESLADDNTTLTIMEEASLHRVRQILNDFASFSGLECNFEKSCVLLTTEPTLEERDMVTRSGFAIAESINLLGITIKASLDNVDEIFEKIITKISNNISYWERFKLSIPGRITIAKTFLVSQLNYVGCFLQPSEGILTRCQLLIDNFVKKKLKHCCR
jgi:hypothetical protein